MIFRESETVELKEVVVDDIKKEIIAFANCNGGKLYIGVQDDGTVVGLDNPDGTALQISNMVRDAIKPDITMFLHYETLEEDGKKDCCCRYSTWNGSPLLYCKKRNATRRSLCQTGIFSCSCYRCGNPPDD